MVPVETLPSTTMPPTTTLLLTNSTAPGGRSPSFENLVPALLQCFVVVLSGYVAGRSGLVSVSQGKGIAIFLTTFCLPALLFKAMCTLDFSQVNWNFLLAILVSKVTVFVVVSLVTMLVKRNLPVGYAGLYAVFATQSNDFALGYPLIQALYENTRPHYVNYIYLIAPISLLILNPIGFIMMEIHRHIHPDNAIQQTEESATSCPATRRKRQDSTGSSNGGGAGGEKRQRSVGVGVRQVLKGVLLNPIVFMTAIGFVGNLVFSQKVPSLLDNALLLLGEAFSGTALFYLGLSMVDRVKTSVDKALIVPLLLILAKSLLLPMVTWEVVSWLQPDEATSTDLSMYGFLYGTFPTAPAVVLFATQYNLGQDTVSRGLVIGTMLSAPLMFASAEMMTVVVSNESDYHSIILNTAFDVSIVSIVACVWVLGVFVFSGRWRRVPHRFTVCLVASQMVACIGMVMSRAVGETKGGWHYVQFVTMLLGVFSSRCWTAALSVACCLLHTRSLCSVLKAQVWLMLLGFGLPCVMTGMLFMVEAKHISVEIDPSFHYGFIQTLFSAIVLAMSLAITLVFVVVWQRNARHYPPYSPVPTTTTTTPSLAGDDGDTVSIQVEGDAGVSESSALSPKYNYESCTQPQSCSSIEDIIPFPTQGGQLRSDSSAVEDHGIGLEVATIDERTCLLGRCSAEERRECRQRLRHYAAAIEGVGGDSPQDEESMEREEGLKEEYQSTHHLLLLVMLSASMFVGLFLCLWKIIKNQVSGIYVEVEFLDSFFNYGQAFLVMLIFGFDTRLVFSPIMRRVRRWLYRAELVRLPEPWELDEETKTTCQQFVTFHLSNCRARITREGRFRLRRYQNIFTGAELCEWLMEAGLAADQGEAVTYGRRLLLGRVIAHVTGVHHFQCSRFFYNFVDSDDASC